MLFAVRYGHLFWAWLLVLLVLAVVGPLLGPEPTPARIVGALACVWFLGGIVVLQRLDRKSGL